MLEIVWDTTPFNDPELWPADGSQPFVLSTGDRSGYSQHADYVFGWKGQELQKAMNAGCAAANCPGIKVQSLKKAKKCKVKPLVKEKSEGCKFCFLDTVCDVMWELTRLDDRVECVAWWDSGSVRCSGHLSLCDRGEESSPIVSRLCITHWWLDCVDVKMCE